MDPDRQVCDAINAPAALARYFLIVIADKLWPHNANVEMFLETVMYFALVGLLWYLVGLKSAIGFEPVVCGAFEL